MIASHIRPHIFLQIKIIISSYNCTRLPFDAFCWNPIHFQDFVWNTRNLWQTSTSSNFDVLLSFAQAWDFLQHMRIKEISWWRRCKEAILVSICIIKQCFRYPSARDIVIGQGFRLSGWVGSCLFCAVTMKTQSVILCRYVHLQRGYVAIQKNLESVTFNLSQNSFFLGQLPDIHKYIAQNYGTIYKTMFIIVCITSPKLVLKDQICFFNSFFNGLMYIFSFVGHCLPYLYLLIYRISHSPLNRCQL